MRSRIWVVGALSAMLATAATLLVAAQWVGGEPAGGRSGSGYGAAPFGFSEVVFLSHVDSRRMPIFPGDPKPVVRTLFTVADDGFKLNLMKIGEHSGTHWGAPCHFNAGERCADRMAPEDFFHPAAVIDARRQSARDPDYRLTVADLREFESEHGRIPADAMVVMRTGYAARWDRPRRYLGADAEGVLHYPGFGAAATRWLIARREIGGLGIDTHGIDPGDDETFLANTLLLRDHRIHLENLSGLGRMPALGGWIVVGGVRNVGGSGSPATVFGLVP